MTINIVKDERYKDLVTPYSIHGKHPYKLYLEIKGNSNIGTYIAVISDDNFIKIDDIDKIVVKLEDKNKHRKSKNMQIVKPNMLGDGFSVTYNVRETSILKVGDIPMHVYKIYNK